MTVPIINGPQRRLPYTDMTAKQLFEKAQLWWDDKGIDLTRHNRNRPRDGVDGDKEILTQSGILAGKLFADLSQAEMCVIAEKYYMEYCKTHGVPEPLMEDIAFVLQNS